PGILLLSGSGPGPDGGLGTVTVHDEGNTAPSDWILENGALVRRHHDGSAVTQIYYGDITTLAIDGGSGGNTFTDTGTGGSNRVVLNGAGVNALVGANANTTWSLSGPNGGQVGIIAFAGIQNLTGGSGDDTIQLAAGASVSGRIDGGGGVNTLDYSAWATGVGANLTTGTATPGPGGRRHPPE